MLNFNLLITNPFFAETFNNLFCKSGMISANKAWEIQLYRHTTTLLMTDLKLSANGRDHAGLSVAFGLFGRVIELSIYDTRHWDYKHNCWESE